VLSYAIKYFQNKLHILAMLCVHLFTYNNESAIHHGLQMSAYEIIPA